MKLIKFYTQTCTPCKVMKPIIDKLVSNYSEVLEYEEIDCTEGVPDEWSQAVRSVPTVIITSIDKPYKKAVGIKSYEYLESLISQ